MNRPTGLGRGLAALIPTGGAAEMQLIEVPLSQVVPNPRQPRATFDDAELEGLAVSIRDMGLLQPIVIRRIADDRYELIAGERRLRASKLAGLTRIPAVVRQTDDGDRLKEALVENIHRVALNPLEEAAAYRQLLDDFDFTQEELSEKIGKSRPAISNAMRLLTLPPTIQRKVAAGVLSAGHARALLSLKNPDTQLKVADRIVAEGMSVRSTEELVRLQSLGERDGSGGGRGSSGSKRISSPALTELQEQLSDALATRVKISMGAKSGKVAIEFQSVHDLERIVATIARGVAAEANERRAASSTGD